MTMKPLLVRRSHSLPLAEVRRRLERVALQAQERHHVACYWREGALEVFAPPGMAAGARGRVWVGERDVSVELHLPLRFSPARLAIESRLLRKMDDLLRA